MLSPEVFVLFGSVMVVGSLLGLIAAQYARHWFFTQESRVPLQRVEARSSQNQEQSRRALQNVVRQRG